MNINEPKPPELTGTLKELNDCRAKGHQPFEYSWVVKALCAQIDTLKARVTELEKRPSCRRCGDEIDNDETVRSYPVPL